MAQNIWTALLFKQTGKMFSMAYEYCNSEAA